MSSRSRKNRRRNSRRTIIAPNEINLREHRKLIPNLKFKEVPIVNIDVFDNDEKNDNYLTTKNFIERVQQYSQRTDVIESGGFMIMRPNQSDKHRYLIDPSKIKTKWHSSKHSDKHYYINSKRNNCHNNKPYNDEEWVYDIPQLSKFVDGAPLLVGAYPQETQDVLTPFFTRQDDTKQQNNHNQKKNRKVSQRSNKNKNQNKHKKNDNNAEDDDNNNEPVFDMNKLWAYYKRKNDQKSKRVYQYNNGNTSCSINTISTPTPKTVNINNTNGFEKDKSNSKLRIVRRKRKRRIK